MYPAAAGERARWGCDRLREARRSASAAGARRRHGGAPASCDPTSTRRCSTRAACSRSSSGTSPGTPRRWSSRSAASPQEAFLRVARLITENSGRDRTTAFVYASGWTQHTVGVQYIRTAVDPADCCSATSAAPAAASWRCAGTPASRGPPTSRPCSTCCPATCRCRTRTGTRTSTPTSRARSPATGFWANMRAYMVSLLKAWWGDAATADNDFCFDYLPRLTGNHSTYETVMAQIDGTCKGYFLFGENPAVGSANARMQRLGMANLDWLVVRDFALIESATFWKDGPEIETGELRTEDIGTEVFFLPAAAHTEKDGSFTNTQRMLQWHHKAVEPAGDARSDLWFAYHLGRRIRRSWPARPTTWTGRCSTSPGTTRSTGRWPSPTPRRCSPRSTAGTPTASRCPRTPQLKDDGSTACGCWIYCGVVRRRGQPGRPAQARQRAELGGARVGLGLAGQPADPLQPRLGRPGRQAVERAQGPGLVGRGGGQVDRARRPRLRRRPAAVLPAAGGRHRRGRDLRHRPVHHAGRRQGVAVRPGRAGRRPAAGALRAAGVAVPQPALRPAAQPGPARSSRARTNRYQPSGDQPGSACSPTSPPPTG